MYINKRVEASWTFEEEKKIRDFRQFLQSTAKKVEDLLPSLYEKLYEIDASLYNILYESFDEDVDLDDKENK